MALTFDDLLSLDFPGDAVATAQSSLLVIGQAEARARLVQQLMGRSTQPSLSHLHPPPSLNFGYAILTAPFPLLISSLTTERNTTLNKLSLFGWVEDNFITEPRSEVFGLTPFGEQPVLFLRDFDLDRPVEALMHAAPDRWLRVAGVVIADANYPAGQAGEMQELNGDQGALAALNYVLPADAHDFLVVLTSEVGSGRPLRAVLRARRKTTDDALMHVCDGWRILAGAVKVVRVNPFADAGAAASANLVDPIRLERPRAW